MENYQEVINSLLKSTGGSLKIFGKFWGRPFDDFHEIKSIEDLGSHIVIYFKTYSLNTDCLKVWNPSRVELNNVGTKLWFADKVIHSWENEPISVGIKTVRPVTYYREYVLQKGTLQVFSSFEPYEEFIWKNEPAIELIKS